MRTGTSITVSATDRRRLEKIVSDRNAAQKPVWRSEIVLLTARGLGTHAIMARTGKAPIPTEKVAEVVRLTRATHWTARAMARAAGLGVTTVQRNRAAHGLAPHRRRVFKLSRDPALVEKLADIAGLYVSPPAHAVVFSADEKSHIQALDRTRPGLPLKKGRDAAMTHDDKRNGATTLLAAANVLTGEVFGKNMAPAPHRAREPITFLNALKRDIPS